jgi:hypothetical protein
MTCRRFKKDMLLEVYGELEARRRRRLEGHLEKCDSCRRELETTRRVMASLDALPSEATPEADWDRSWKAIEATIETRPSRALPRRAFLPRWAFAPLALAALFVLGVFVGRFTQPGRPGPVPAARLAGKLSPAAVETLLGRYFDSVTPVLLDYSNDGTTPATAGSLRTDRREAASLRVENLLLRRALARRNPALADLFEDLDMILTDISHLRRDDPSATESLRETINRRQVLDRIRRFDQI